VPPSSDREVVDPSALAPCALADETLCLVAGRFRVRVAWRTAQGAGRGKALPVGGAPSSGLFWFFAPSNLELLVKVLDGCSLGARRYWVFLAAVTDIELNLEVADTATGSVRRYENRLGTPARTVLDTDAFPVCP
jgi:hypothetical protein